MDYTRQRRPRSPTAHNMANGIHHPSNNHQQVGTAYIAGTQHFHAVAAGGNTGQSVPPMPEDDDRSSDLARLVRPVPGMGIGPEFAFDLPLCPNKVQTKPRQYFNPNEYHYDADSRYLNDRRQAQATTAPSPQKYKGTLTFTGLRPSIFAQRESLPPTSSAATATQAPAQPADHRQTAGTASFAATTARAPAQPTDHRQTAGTASTAEAAAHAPPPPTARGDAPPSPQLEHSPVAPATGASNIPSASAPRSSTSSKGQNAPQTPPRNSSAKTKAPKNKTLCDDEDDDDDLALLGISTPAKSSSTKKKRK